MEIINLDTWNRAEHYHFFRRMDYPQYLVCANIDITHFHAMIKAKGVSFYYGMIYAATYALNQVKEFKYRIEGEKVILHDTIHPSFTDITSGSDLFKIVTVELEDSMDDFISKAKLKSEQQRDYFVLDKRSDLTYITCLPWVSFTNLSHTITLNRDDSVPRLAWGKYFEENGKLLMPFSVQAHHSFVDGIHMGKYYDVLQKFLNAEMED